MEIKNSYLMWIGSDHYKTIEDWTGEAVTQGISKRLPNADVGQALTSEGTAIFVAHDEGSFHECPDCLGTIENPERRKLQQEAKRIDAESKELQTQLINVAGEGPEADKERDRLTNLINNRGQKIAKLIGQIKDQPEQVEGGTGGHALVTKGEGLDTERWDYRKYNYWLHQPKVFNASDVLSKEMCECCGGTGRLPDAKVFGLFIPDAVEYILKAEDTELVKDKMEGERGFRTVTEQLVKVEPKRKCGKRHPGGVYVVTDVKEGETKSAKEVVEQLVKDGIVTPEGVEINGSFIRFLNPIDVEVKRFRGIKRWSLDPRAEDEAEMILEAIA